VRLKRPLLVGAYVTAVQAVAVAATALLEKSMRVDWAAGVRLAEVLVLVALVPGVALWTMPRVIGQASSRVRRPVWIATSGLNLVLLLLALGLEEAGLAGWIVALAFMTTMFVVVALVVFTVERSTLESAQSSAS
jgi:hypothetical protein